MNNNLLHGWKIIKNETEVWQGSDSLHNHSEIIIKFSKILIEVFKNLILIQQDIGRLQQ